MKRSIVLVLIALLLAAGAGAFFYMRPRETLPEDPLAIVPADAYGLVRIHMDRVMASEAWKALVVERGHAASMQEVEKTCGYNPLARLTDVVVFARPNPKGGFPRFSFAAKGKLEHKELIECVEKVTGVKSDQLKTEEIDGVITVASSGGGSRAAFVGRDGILGGDADSVRHLIAVLHHKADSVTSDPLVRELFRKIDGGQEISMVVRVPDPIRPQLRRLGDGLLGGALRPLAEVRAFAANASLANAKVAAAVTLLSSDEREAQTVVKLVKAQMARFLAVPGVVLTPAGKVLQGIQIEAIGTRATFTGSMRVSAVEGLLDLLPAFMQLKDSFLPADPQAPGTPAAPAAPGGDSTSAPPEPAAAPSSP